MHYIWTELFILFLTIFVAKILAKKTNTVDVLWYIVLGAVLGNLHILSEDHRIEFLGEIGIILVMFALGFEENLSNFLKGVKKAWGIAIIGAIFPFLAGFLSAKFFGFSTNSALIWGLTMTATAVSLTMVSLKSLGLEKTPAATGIMTSAVVDDVLSLIGVAVLLPIILSGNTQNGNLVVDFEKLMNTFFDVLAFFGFVYLVGKFIVPHKKGIRYLFIVDRGNYAVLGVFILVFLFGDVAHILGFHPAIGAYFAGLILKAEYFEVGNQNRAKEIEKITNTMAFTVFGPVFFILLGGKIIFEPHILKEVIIPTLTLFVLVLVFQVLSAAFAAKYTGGYSSKDSWLIGFGMLGRAELAFIVLNITYVQNHLISQEEFYTLMFVTFLLNISVPLLLKWYKPIYESE
ncbi:cation:proton antiporter [Caminibacter pacificus]|uniref:Cation:proton antiporter n=1 Tax=Caminibacter pacificus TaxID=1424653 RepID=A0AAJ4RE11_9BACT|nr:cation:proton antiporter [Caminibacter pacificus]NPA87588.1 cation:proton antiporter [Campylobacterota bacterium]QCI28276.1 cation:proton antiporter [Caminibacter pacificus]ROR41010.1 transporter (CPA2 family) [Caminibacter pacificus]